MNALKACLNIWISLKTRLFGVVMRLGLRRAPMPLKKSKERLDMQSGIDMYQIDNGKVVRRVSIIVPTMNGKVMVLKQIKSVLPAWPTGNHVGAERKKSNGI